MKQINQIIKYLDMFGIRGSFYIEKSPKLYSFTGGILSIITIFICIIFFILISLDDFKRISPLVSISSVQPKEHHKINFGKEKIWIPWRIRDYSNNFVNHTNLFYPFIYNYYSINKSIDKGFEFEIKQLNYTLCSKTSFINRSELFNIDSSLDELFCIELDDIDIGGDWTSDYLSYIEFNLYLCKEGIDYDENNPYCTRYENISHYLRQNNSLMVSLYYPIIQFKANKAINPMTIIYREKFYKISRYTNKIDKIYLQKNILKDDIGWLTNKYKETSYWGLNILEGDSYTIGNKRDFNDGSTSRVYSFNIYLDSSINIYNRSYKKLYIIVSECMPIIYTVSFLFNMIGTFCKFYTINKNFTEYLFINLKEKSFDKKIKQLKQINEKNDNNNNINDNFQSNSYKKINKFTFNENIKKNFDSYANLSSKKNNVFHNKLISPIKEKVEFSIKDNSLEVLNHNHNYPRALVSSKSNIFKDIKPLGRHTIKTNANLHNNNIKLDPSLSNNNINDKIKKKNVKVENTQIRFQSLFKELHKPEPHKHYIHKKLFPSKYYFYSIFIRNFDNLKKTKILSRKYIQTYMFISKLLDVYSYFDLIREFNVFTTYFLKEKNINLIERNRKINIGEITFMKNIKDCFENNHFRIFGKKKDDK